MAARYTDGGELYHYRSAAEFDDGSTWRRTTFPASPSGTLNDATLRTSYPALVDMSYGVYDGGGMTDAIVQVSMERAIAASTNYAWWYSESQLTIDKVVTGSNSWYTALAAVSKGGKKMLFHGHPGAPTLNTAAYINANLATLEARAFDGYDVYPWNFSGQNVAVTVNSNTPVSVATVDTMIGPLSGDSNPLDFYILIFGGNPPDVFDDWTTVIDNWAHMAESCQAAGFKGIFFDNEYYSGYLGRIRKSANTHAAEHTLQEYQDQTRFRGKQVMDAVKAVWPECDLLTAYGPWVSEDAGAVALDFNPAIPAANDLLGAFAAGFVESTIAAGAGDAAPVIIATTGGNSAANLTDHTINLPDGSNVAGRLLCVFFASDSAPTTTWPTGWTNFTGLPSSAGSAQLNGRWHVVNGTEGYPATGATITVATGTAEGSAHNSYLIKGHSSSTNAPTGSTAASESSTAPSPPLCDPGVVKEYLWIAACDHKGDSATSVYPANYTGGFENRWNSVDGESVSSAVRTLSASSEDPGDFTIAPSATNISFTVAIHPGEEGLPVTSSIPTLCTVIVGIS